MRKLLAAVVLACCVTPPAHSQLPYPRSVFKNHDPDGRLRYTEINKLGTVTVRRAVFSIYYLNFTNPISRHGQQRISIIKNGRDFMGSYHCSLWLGSGQSPRGEPTIKIGKDRITVKVPNFPPDEFVIRFSEHGPTRNRFFCGEGSGWAASI